MSAIKGYITEAEFAAELDLTVWALRAWKKKGFGPTRYKILRRVYYRRDEVDAFLAEHLPT